LAEIHTVIHQISVAHRLDAEIRDELESHFEEKVTAYLSGQEKLTETDALLLARAHFGKPDGIESLFRHVHMEESYMSFTRRICLLIRVPFLACFLLLSAIVAILIAVWREATVHTPWGDLKSNPFGFGLYRGKDMNLEWGWHFLPNFPDQNQHFWRLLLRTPELNSDYWWGHLFLPWWLPIIGCMLLTAIVWRKSRLRSMPLADSM